MFLLSQFVSEEAKVYKEQVNHHNPCICKTKNDDLTPGWFLRFNLRDLRLCHIVGHGVLFEKLCFCVQLFLQT